MPNWIGNKLYIVGPAQDIAAFKTKNRDAYVPVQAKGARLKTTKAALSLDSHSEYPKKKRVDGHSLHNKHQNLVVVDLSFNKMVPVPLVVNDSWHTKHWGCMWDAYYPELVRESKRRLFYRFSTPWNPPFAWLIRVSKRFPSLRFSLHYWNDIYDRWDLVRIVKGDVA